MDSRIMKKNINRRQRKINLKFNQITRSQMVDITLIEIEKKMMGKDKKQIKFYEYKMSRNHIEH